MSGRMSSQLYFGSRQVCNHYLKTIASSDTAANKEREGDMIDTVGRTIRSQSAIATLIVISTGVSGLAMAQESEPVSLDLTPKLQDLLLQEMQSIEQASKDILSALIAGDDARVAELAQQIHKLVYTLRELLFLAVLESEPFWMKTLIHT